MKRVVLVTIAVGLVLIFCAVMISLLYAGARMASKPVERYVRVYSSDDPPPPAGELVWYYNPSLIPAWRHALYLDGRWPEYSGDEHLGAMLPDEAIFDARKVEQ